MTEKSAGWRPIETAPLNGDDVLLLIEQPENPLHNASRSVSIGAYGVDGGRENDPTWCFAGWDWCADKYVRGGGTPTHWMPLPPPPEGMR
ncbi:MAG TPA: hypothetical protein DCZ11_05265 [Gammaproteobacteria bacterium]|nr:hypothetical protein [Gammaproteobacteria bacterium]MCH77832.1 hypothetical protein [Gammaproteobacteria bacterium]